MRILIKLTMYADLTFLNSISRPVDCMRYCLCLYCSLKDLIYSFSDNFYEILSKGRTYLLNSDFCAICTQTSGDGDTRLYQFFQAKYKSSNL